MNSTAPPPGPEPRDHRQGDAASAWDWPQQPPEPSGSDPEWPQYQQPPDHGGDQGPAPAQQWPQQPEQTQQAWPQQQPQQQWPEQDWQQQQWPQQEWPQQYQAPEQMQPQQEWPQQEWPQQQQAWPQQEAQYQEWPAQPVPGQYPQTQWAGAAAPASVDVAEPAIDLTVADPAAAFANRTIGEVILQVRDLEVYYGAAVALKGISFEVRRGEVVVIIGANGAGKTTTMKTISGLSEPLKTVRGDVVFGGEHIAKLPAHKVQRLGLAHVPEGRHIFGESSVEDNLLLGSIRRMRGADRGEINRDVERMYERFPVLGDRRNRPAGLLSGGEQQMLAICRALMSRPDVLLLDEPSLGLAPIMITAVFDIIKELAAEGVTILLVEQMANKALEIADRAYVLETGAITLEGTGRALLEDERVKAAYLGA